ncbi:WD repeat-containing protein 89 [Diorhabda sublineata]|uniref:WD repeat-containing protein 89 n=1 Tax=Diorhabda sublineata TaxID=1163346 RepID=UPI0024E0F9B1|nr:WD repeat-containing protein 89 [Diorhabda sublineata]
MRNYELKKHDNATEYSVLNKCECLCEVNVASDYVFNIDVTKENNPHIAVAAANKSSVLYNLDNNQISKIWEYNYNNKVIGCKFNNRDRNLVYVATSDGLIKVLDLRTPKNFIFQFSDTTVENGDNKLFNCFDLSSNDRLLAAGTDVWEGDAYILFWDTRNTKLLGAYWESHDDDITQVKFHPDDMNKLISGSTDGLINVYDLSKACEDDALIDTLNTELSVHELLWFNNRNKDCISCISHTSDLQLWDLDNGAPYVSFSGEQLSKNIGINDNEDESDAFYLAKCNETSNGLLIVAGKGECHRLSKIQNNSVVPFVELHNNKQRIMDSTFNENSNILITGGEKGLINIWRITDQV